MIDRELILGGFNSPPREKIDDRRALCTKCNGTFPSRVLR